MSDKVSTGRIHPDFLTERQGKTFVLYAGLLDLAHQEGLTSLTVRLVQVPSEDNEHTAICMAEAITKKGTFAEIGDANPGNVGRMIIPHIIRMAATRAKARALRDATNIGVTALEEIGDDEPADQRAVVFDRSERPTRQSEPPRTYQATPPDYFDGQTAGGDAPPRPPEPQYRPQPAPTNGEHASEKQINALRALLRKKRGFTADEMNTYFGVPLVEISKAVASEAIGQLQKEDDV